MEMTPAQGKVYMRFRDGGYEFDQMTEDGDIIIKYWDRVGDSQTLSYSFKIHPDGTCTEILK